MITAMKTYQTGLNRRLEINKETIRELEDELPRKHHTKPKD